MMSSRWFRGEASSVPQARGWIVEQASRHGRRHQADDAALCVSELAANAVSHAATTFRVDVSDECGALHIEVCDTGNSAANVTIPDTSDVGRPGGRGLQIIEALAARWGVRHHRRGTLVWLDLE